MKIKIEIKHWITGSVLFEYEKENNTIKDTLVEANLREADLREADLREANLRGADLYEADLRGANLRGADLYGADLRGANLRGANLRGADLYGADLRGANLRGADLREADLIGKIKKAIVISGLYKYVVIPYITETDEQRVKMGCYDRTLKEWDEDFWNNPSEFPNDGNEESNLRVFAFETAKRWIELNK